MDIWWFREIEINRKWVKPISIIMSWIKNHSFRSDMIMLYLKIQNEKKEKEETSNDTCFFSPLPRIDIIKSKHFAETFYFLRSFISRCK